MSKLPIALGSLQGWLWILFLGGPLLGKLLAGNTERLAQLFLVFMFFNALSYFLCALWVYRWFSTSARSYLFILCALMISGCTFVLGLGAASWSPVVLCVFAALAGLGFAPLICAMGEAFSRETLQHAGLFYGLAVLVGTLSLVLATYMPVKMALLITGVLPLLCLCFLLSIPRLNAANADTGDELQLPDNMSPFTIRLILLIVLFYLVGGIMFNIVLLLPHAPHQQMFWISNILYGAVVLAAGAGIYYSPSFHLRIIYQPALPLLGAGFLLIPFLQGSSLIVAFILLQVGFALFDIYIWMLFTRMASRAVNPFRLFAMGYFVVTFSMFLGAYLFKWLFPLLSLNISEIDGLALVGALIMFAATFLFHKFQGIQWHMDGPAVLVRELDAVLLAAAGRDYQISLNPQDDDERYLDVIAEQKGHWPLRNLLGKNDTYRDDDSNPLYNEDKINTNAKPSEGLSQQPSPALQMAHQYQLTNRETEIFELLIKGYNNPNICDKLTISPNTLKTHLRNLYRKTTVSNRQELIDLYQSFPG